MISGDIKILLKLFIVEKMNIYLVTKGVLPIAKKIQN